MKQPLNQSMKAALLLVRTLADEDGNNRSLVDIAAQFERESEQKEERFND
jgi:hypothetical protein